MSKQAVLDDIFVGQKIGYMTVRGFDGRLVFFECQCGNFCRLYRYQLKSQRSCGCMHSASIATAHTTHGESARTRRTPEYVTWINMKQRCLDPKSNSWPSYGARGIKICKRWASFKAFLEDMGRKPTKAHTIDRKNGDGDYSPENCRWATKKEQSINRRLPRKRTCCRRGHEWTPDNTYIDPKHNRRCRACIKIAREAT